MGFILITGANGGIGQVTTKYLASQGYNLILTDIFDPKDLVESLNNSVEIISSKLNVSSKSSVLELFEKLNNENIILQGLVNLAGITRDKTILKMDEEDWDIVINVNLKGAYFMSKYSAEIMKSNGGSIIHIGSTSAHQGNFGQANYAASKMALEAFSRSAAREFAKYNIRVNCVVPGYVETPMTDQIPDEYRSKTIDSIPLGRIGKPLDVAHAIEFLLSEKSSFITGSSIRVDGGLRM